MKLCFEALAGRPRTEVAVADSLRRLRRRFYETGDPTFLAYVLYGDPNLRLRNGL